MLYAKFLSSRIWEKVFNFNSAFVAARALFKGLLDPNCFAKIFFTPASSRIVRTAPPAITPDPGADGRIITFAAPDCPVIIWGIELFFVTGTLTRCFLLSVTAFFTAPITSLAFPTPTPTCPFSFPMIRIARKLSFFPPFTTLVTLLTWTILYCQSVSFSFSLFVFLRLDIVDFIIKI